MVPWYMFVEMGGPWLTPWDEYPYNVNNTCCDLISGYKTLELIGTGIYNDEAIYQGDYPCSFGDDPVYDVSVRFLIYIQCVVDEGEYYWSLTFHANDMQGGIASFNRTVPVSGIEDCVHALFPGGVCTATKYTESWIAMCRGAMGSSVTVYY